MSECCMTRDEAFKSGIAFDIQNLVEKAYQYGYEKGKDEAYKNPVPTQDAYMRGLNDAWEASKYIFTMDEEEAEKSGFDQIDYYNTTASEAIEKLRAYEAQKQKEEEEIKVGDEVILNAKSSYGQNKKAVIIALDDDSYPYHVMIDNGYTEWIRRDFIYRKTGQNFPQIVEVLKKLGEGE